MFLFRYVVITLRVWLSLFEDKLASIPAYSTSICSLNLPHMYHSALSHLTLAIVENSVAMVTNFLSEVKLVFFSDHSYDQKVSWKNQLIMIFALFFLKSNLIAWMKWRIVIWREYENTFLLFIRCKANVSYFCCHAHFISIDFIFFRNASRNKRLEIYGKNLYRWLKK